MATYNKIDNINKRTVWKKLLNNFTPYNGFEVEDYYGVSLIKLKKGGLYSIRLIHDYTSRGLMSSSYVVTDFQRALKILSILEWFAKDEMLRAVEDDEETDLDEEDSDDLSDNEIDF